ncbi:MAG: threonine synthase [Bacillota bacterium]|jgi:threonine synthase
MLICAHCDTVYPENEPRWRCPCGGYLHYRPEEMFQPHQLAGRPTTLWRYREPLGILSDANVVSLGEGFTPLVADRLEDQPVLFKLDQLCPTGSFKDRGSAVMLSKLKEWGVGELIEDSSGNAGASVAAYASRAKIKAHIYIPAYTSAGKAAQIAMYGADLIKVPGTREDTAQAAWDAAEQQFYASHNWSPYFLNGLKTLAYEIAEQLGWQAPDWVVAPVGGGSSILGLYLGFKDLEEAGIIDRLPRLAAVQAKNCAPVFHAWRQGLTDVPAVQKQETAAEGISIAKPVKGRDILRAIRATDGVVLTVEDQEIWDMLTELGQRGIYVEPTAAAAPAALRQLRHQGLVSPGQHVVVQLTGSGLKATDKIVDHYSARR